MIASHYPPLKIDHYRKAQKLMANQTQCLLDSNIIDIDTALQLRNAAKETNQKRPDFRCLACGEPTKPHMASGHGAAHFEHLNRNPDCPLCHVGYIPVDARPSAAPLKPDYSIDDPKAIEGYEIDRQITVRARHQGIVQACKERDDFRCLACGFRLQLDGKFIIECHHVKPLAEYGEREISLSELICLCPTCHRIAHTRQRPFDVTELKQLLREIPENT
ncbi:HNH endonuclease [Pseudomonas sp. PDM03]|uniref:HNH endonuclease n=1 Tax=Pseudomonas sp. PDM03 TaxID=2769266 RepID=UPI00177D2F61|nr:HNH endonuclease [Pseudomonas sp. PDM03]MBD9588970.1 HNH endonuclease [Pseudomonas sp. PDM03]